MGFDKELIRVFPQYDVNDPIVDLPNLTPTKWKEIRQKQIRERAQELESGAAKQRLEAKLNKIEKLWKASRQKDKKKGKKHKKNASSRQIIKEQKEQSISPNSSMI